MSDTPIVVGTDGSAFAQAAVDVAASEAALRSCPLKLVFAFAPRYSRYDIKGSGVAQPILDECARVLETEKARVQEWHPELEVETRFLQAQPAEVLVEESKNAELVVVGARGLGAIRRFFVGSVSRAVAQDAACPVLIVRKGADNESGPVVVGLAPDSGAGAVLDHAFRLAELRKVKLQAIHARQHAGANVYDIELEAFREAVTQRMAAVDKDLKDLYRKTAAKHPKTEASFRSSSAHAIDALLDAAEGASLLVIGRCSDGRRNRQVLGSVAEGILSEAPRVVVVPPLS